MATQQSTIEAAGYLAATDTAHTSTLKSILVHVQDDLSLEQRVETALSLARPTSAHLSFVHVTPTEAYVASDRFGGIFVMESVMKAVDEQAVKLRERLQDKLSPEDVSWDYDEITGDVLSAIISRAALADLVVTSRTPDRQDFVGATVQLLGHLLYHCRSPLFILGDNVSGVDPTEAAAIAWDGSYEAANAVRASIGMLKLARAVTVIQVAEQKDERFPRTKMLEYLSRHGIHAELTVLSRSEDYWDGEAVAGALVTAAQEIGVVYVVMGGYSHSRVGEYLFGGVTRSLLNSCSIGLVIAH
jgi:nucleotide-binding universal stress UspA family protein